MIALGIGCRRGVAKDEVLDIVREALVRVNLGGEAMALFSVEDKHSEAGLLAAAAELRLPLTFLPRAALQDVEAYIATPSPHAEAALGLASVSEAAALAGAGEGGVLILPRIAGDGVTCAAALGDER
ncbi:cobalamin biosynthesis protein [uncultured Methylovirgula sp.]|uniref:cobalamin biosynthesis protein n=1 Tax=uncultured Methylovirgula sp. TaxID=1285960 RepID=UPI002617537E|nr:cobalamin biosynthesis protein [uncultured Methylovirgula sp.]